MTRMAGRAVRYADMDRLSPDRRINSHIWVSTDPPDRHLPVSAALEANPFPIRVHPCESVVSLLRVSLSQSASICVNLRFQHFISFPEFQMPLKVKGCQLNHISATG